MSYYPGAGRGGESLYRFEDCMLDTGRHDLRRERGFMPIEPRVSDLLECLIRNRDHMVSKDDLPTGPCIANPPCWMQSSPYRQADRRVPATPEAAGRTWKNR